MIGETISKYRIVEKIGEGGMGVVYRAQDVRLGRDVALKLLAPELTRDSPARTRFLQEARTVSSFEHPNICVVHEVDETEDGRMFMAMTYYQGETLREKIARGPLPPGQAADIAEQVARGLARAHEQQIVHRDIKPANILVPDRGPVKILDFGIAKLIGGTRLTQEGRTLGTALYMSPEQVAGDPVDPRTDLWSLGVVLYEMLAGVPPFLGDHPQATLYLVLNVQPRLEELRARVPPALLEVVRRCLEKRPERRHASAGELAEELGRLRGAAASGLVSVDWPVAELGLPPTLQELRVVQDRVPFVGREEQLGRLEGLLREALAGGGRVVFVSGEPGIGKTALVTELTRRARSAFPDLVSAGGKCNAQTGIGDPYLPFREILAQLTSDTEPGWTAEAGAIARGEGTFRACLQALLDTGPDLVGTFAPARALAARAASLATDDPDGFARLERLLERREAAAPPQQSDLFEQYKSVLQRLSRQRPLLLVIEDLHWADAGSISLLFHLSRRLAGSRILLAATYRPAEVALGSGPQRHPLAPVLNELRRELPDLEVDLNAADGERFLEALFASEPNSLEPGFREALFRLTQGHPLFSIELLRDMRENGILTKDSQGVWKQRSAISWEDLPARVEAVAAERLGHLPEDLYRVLAAASVEGEDFTAEVLARLQGIGEREMVQLLGGELDRRHRLVTALGVRRVGGRRLSRYRFVHNVFQRYLYTRLDEAERSYLHEEVGGALEELYGDRVQEIAVVLARHFTEAGALHKAVEYFGRAGHAANALSAHGEAAGHYQEALKLLAGWPSGPERDRAELDLLAALAPALNTTLGYASPEVERVCDRALELSRELGGGKEFGWLLYGIWAHTFVSGALEKSLDLAFRLVQFGESQGDPALRIQGHLTVAESSEHLGDFEAAREHAEKGWQLCQAHGSSESIRLTGQDAGVLILNNLSWVHWILGSPDRALACRDQSTARASEIAHPWSSSMARLGSFWLRQFLRDAPRVEEETRQLIESSEGQGAYLATLAKIFRGWSTAVMTGEDAAAVEAGIAMLRQAYADNAATGARLSQAYYLSLLIEVCLLHGRFDEAGEALETAFSITEATGEHFWSAEIYRLRGELVLRTGGEEEAEDWFQRALENARHRHARSLELRAAMALARLRIRQGRNEAGRELLAEVYGGFEEGFGTADLIDAQALLAELETPYR
ncbi:MAG TPA: protein kinase [Thermoanaerobaculia bacterium]|nr:protein kinase [Thermoanaerobaculia bacterium]